jgi:hypothetical protein
MIFCSWASLKIQNLLAVKMCLAKDRDFAAVILQGPTIVLQGPTTVLLSTTLT